MTGPTKIEEIPWTTGEEEPARLHVAKPRPCRHPREKRVRMEPRGYGADETPYDVCVCGHRFDPAKQRRGRAVRKYGKKEELMDARELGLEPRGTARDQEDSGGALDPAVVQSKTGPIHYPSAAWIRELDELGAVAAGRPRILVATPKTGRGVKRRKVAILYLDELQDLTGLTARRKALELVAAEARRIGAALDWHNRYSETSDPRAMRQRAARAGGVPDLGEAERRLGAALEELDACRR